MQFEELEMTGTSEKGQCMNTLAQVTKKLRILQSLYGAYRSVKLKQKEGENYVLALKA